MEDGMKKLLSVSLLLFVIVSLESQAFGAVLNCSFKNPDITVAGIKTLQIADDVLVVNDSESIQLQHSRIKCGQFGRQHRFDGLREGLQIILKSCTDEADLQGHLIDNSNSKAAEVVCDVISE